MPKEAESRRTIITLLVSRISVLVVLGLVLSACSLLDSKSPTTNPQANSTQTDTPQDIGAGAEIETVALQTDDPNKETKKIDTDTPYGINIPDENAPQEIKTAYAQGQVAVIRQIVTRAKACEPIFIFYTGERVKLWNMDCDNPPDKTTE